MVEIPDDKPVPLPYLQSPRKSSGLVMEPFQKSFGGQMGSLCHCFHLQALVKIMSPIPACREGSGSGTLYPSLSSVALCRWLSAPWGWPGQLWGWHGEVQRGRVQTGRARCSSLIAKHSPPLFPEGNETLKANQILRPGGMGGF